MAINIKDVIGHDYTSIEVQKFVREYSLDEVYDDPPLRRYVGSQKKGVDLLFENNRLTAIQIFVRPAQGFLAFPGEIPFEIKGDMNQDQVHQVLGAPNATDHLASKYQFSDFHAKLAVNFNEKSEITYLNISILK